MKTLKEKIIIAVLAIVCLTVSVLAPKNDNIFKCGDGMSLKELNEQKKEEQKKVNMSMSLSANQTTEQSLFQAVVVGGYSQQIGNFTFGGNVVGCVSTEFGICSPVNFVSASYAFNNSSIEYRVGNFKRTGLISAGLDPQYANHMVILGEGASASNAMQLSYNISKTKIFVGHQGGASFFRFDDGYWFTGVETNIANCLSLTGGVDMCKNAPLTGYAAVKFSKNNNVLNLSANKLGTDNQNIVLTYNRNNIAVGKSNMCLTVSAWAQETMQGVHTVCGFDLGNRATLYAEAGAKFTSGDIAPYVGVGSSFVF